MTKTIYNHIDKTLIRTYPVEKFKGRIIVVLNNTEADKAVRWLSSQPIVGIDTETRPSFKKGRHNKVALLQVSTESICFLFRLNLIGLTPSIINLLENNDVIKVGLSLHDDFNQLFQIKKFNPSNCIDLQKCVNIIGIEDLSLQKLYANLFHKRITKGQQLSNWEADILNENQKLYAATDAWACLNIYNEFISLVENNNFKLIKEEKNNNELISENIPEER